MSKRWLLQLAAVLIFSSAAAAQHSRQLCKDPLRRDCIRPVKDELPPVVVMTASDGTVLVRNVSSRNIVGILCEYKATGPDGNPRQGTFSYSFLDPLLLPLEEFPPDAVFDFPRSRWPNTEREIERDSVDCGGVLFEGGEIWGSLGQQLRARLRASAHDALSQLTQIRDRLRKEDDYYEVLELLRSERPIARHGLNRTVVHMSLQDYLFEDVLQERLRTDDPIAEIERLIQHMQNYLKSDS